jgi:hypothetical protein
MEGLVQQAALSQKDFISCNRCWLVMKTVTLADMTTGKCKRIWANCIAANPQEILGIPFGKKGLRIRIVDGMAQFLTPPQP